MRLIRASAASSVRSSSTKAVGSTYAAKRRCCSWLKLDGTRSFHKPTRSGVQATLSHIVSFVRNAPASAIKPVLDQPWLNLLPVESAILMNTDEFERPFGAARVHVLRLRVDKQQDRQLRSDTEFLFCIHSVKHAVVPDRGGLLQHTDWHGAQAHLWQLGPSFDTPDATRSCREVRTSGPLRTQAKLGSFDAQPGALAKEQATQSDSQIPSSQREHTHREIKTIMPHSRSHTEVRRLRRCIVRISMSAFCAQRHTVLYTSTYSTDGLA